MKHLFSLPIHLYRWCISPFLGPEKCRFMPSCSEYTLDALEKHGVVRGLSLGIWRVLRCHPFSRGGWDPIP
ncbi:MAG TPA: membrane protein insertion efficiency factor YidD [Planctomycetes bacterium]|nr:membrane protein insertion efficiency factor YidD [Planctomycetota bacterium]